MERPLALVPSASLCCFASGAPKLVSLADTQWDCKAFLLLSANKMYPLVSYAIRYVG
jgi:hypothetical protein